MKEQLTKKMIKELDAIANVQKKLERTKGSRFGIQATTIYDCLPFIFP